MILHQFANGDTLHKTDIALIATFAGRRKVLSTAADNGGYRENLKWVFNQDCKQDNTAASEIAAADNLTDALRQINDSCGMKAPTYAGHMAVIAAELGLDPSFACGLSTAADMDNVSIHTATYADTTVTAAVTGGIEINGGRVGETANWHETDGKFVYAPGTINILLFIEADLTENGLVQALVTCTEARTAAVQELLAPSCYSSGIATGSGTDGIIVVSDARSEVKLTSAGKHCKLGELIGRIVMTTVKEALFRQTGICAAQQLNIFRRMGRFGVTEESIREMFPDGDLPVTELQERLNRISGRRDLVVHTALYAHLLDELQWGLFDGNDAYRAAKELLVLMNMDTNFRMPPARDSAGTIDEMVTAYRHGIAGLVRDI